MRISDWSSDVCSSDVAAGLKAIQPFLDIARTPANLAGADVVGAGEVTFAHAAIDGRARLEAGDVEHVGDGQKLVLIRRHCVVLSFSGMLSSEERRGGNGWGSTCISRWAAVI